MLSAIGTTRHKEYVIPVSFLDFGFLLLFAVQFSQNITTSSQNTIMKVFTSPLSIVVTYEGKLTSYFSRRTGSLLNCFSRFANQRRIRIVIGPTTVFTVNQTLVNPPFWWISYQFKITVTLHTCTVNAHMSISDENWSRYNCVYITRNIICNIEIQLCVDTTVCIILQVK